MKEINLGMVLIENRHKRGITQEQLAEYMGVSKAAVSKWETGATYPDILMLPRLATYFDISIDELMGYKPQMEKAEIRRWYCRLSEEFASCPFEEALEHCREMAKKYYSCYPFLFQIALLLVNHSMLAANPSETRQIIDEAKELFLRVKNGTDDPGLGKEAVQMEAYCLLFLKHPEEVLELLDTDEITTGPSEPLLASAYQMTGNIQQAKQTLQVGIYKGILILCNLLSSYMNLCLDDRKSFEHTCSRLQALVDIFNLDTLHPGILLSCYLTMAQGWSAFAEKEKALALLEQYTSLATSAIYPLWLHGDSYFYLLDSWFDTSLSLGTYPPRKESIVRHSMTQALADNPAFTAFAKDLRFQGMVSRLKNNEEGKEHASG